MADEVIVVMNLMKLFKQLKVIPREADFATFSRWLKEVNAYARRYYVE